MKLTKDIYQELKNYAGYDGSIEGVSPYVGGGKFCDDSISLYLVFNKSGTKISDIKFIGELSPIGRSTINYLISNSIGRDYIEILDIDFNGFLESSFTPKHRAKQLLFSLVHLKNAIINKVNHGDIIILNELLENLGII